nr:MAG TPA: hypothetical protein [Inoviridae sp.]
MFKNIIKKYQGRLKIFQTALYITPRERGN